MPAPKTSKTCHATQPIRCWEIKLPSSPGVYYFYDNKGLLLYIGKSVNIRNRVMSHFSSDYRNPKDLKMSAKIAHIDFDLTPTDFGAQLRESQQIKQLSPIYNRQLRKTRKLYQYRTEEDSQGYRWLSIQSVTSSAPSDSNFGLFRSPRQASLKLQQLADEFSLCHRLLGLEGTRSGDKGKPCFRAQLNKCLGACYGQESVANYNQRLDRAIECYQMHAWPYPGALLLEEKNADLVAYHIVDQWQYIAKLDLAQDIYDHGYCLAQEALKTNRLAMYPSPQIASLIWILNLSAIFAQSRKTPTESYKALASVCQPRDSARLICHQTVTCSSKNCIN